MRMDAGYGMIRMRRYAGLGMKRDEDGMLEVG